MIAEVYYNRTRNCWSVRHKGRVISHLRELQLRNCTMKVSEAARQRVLRTGKRGVHAWISGTIAQGPLSNARVEEIIYSPFRGRTFQTLSGQAVAAADVVLFEPDGRCYLTR